MSIATPRPRIGGHILVDNLIAQAAVISASADLIICVHEDWESQGFYLYEGEKQKGKKQI